MTQIQLAKAVEIDETGLIAWEKDQRLPEAVKLIRLSETLGVSIDYLLIGRTTPGVDVLIAGLEVLVVEAKRLRLGRHIPEIGGEHLAPAPSGATPATESSGSE